MTKEQVNTIIINGLKSKGIFIGSISPEVLNAFANITYKAINDKHCCTELKDDIKFERKSSARVFNNEKGIWESI